MAPQRQPHLARERAQRVVVKFVQAGGVCAGQRDDTAEPAGSKAGERRQQARLQIEQNPIESLFARRGPLREENRAWQCMRQDPRRLRH